MRWSNQKAPQANTRLLKWGWMICQPGWLWSAIISCCKEVCCCCYLYIWRILSCWGTPCKGMGSKSGTSAPFQQTQHYHFGLEQYFHLGTSITKVDHPAFIASATFFFLWPSQDGKSETSTHFLSRLADLYCIYKPPQHLLLKIRLQLYFSALSVPTWNSPCKLNSSSYSYFFSSTPQIGPAFIFIYF